MWSTYSMVSLNTVTRDKRNPWRIGFFQRFTRFHSGGSTNTFEVLRYGPSENDRWDVFVSLFDPFVSFCSPVLFTWTGSGCFDRRWSMLRGSKFGRRSDVVSWLVWQSAPRHSQCSTYTTRVCIDVSRLTRLWLHLTLVSVSFLTKHRWFPTNLSNHHTGSVWR